MLNRKIITITAILAFTTVTIVANAGQKLITMIDPIMVFPHSPSPVSQLQLAGELIAYGDSKKDPMALILAAKIKKANPEKLVKRKKLAGSDYISDLTIDDYGNSVNAILVRARKLSGKNRALLAMADGVEKMTSRGSISGGDASFSRVSAKSSDIYSLSFKDSELASVGVDGDRGTNMDLFVTNEKGEDICKDTSLTDNLLCEWIPLRTEKFTIEIKNHGNSPNKYVLRNN